ncbi:MAG: hypothetical protein ABIU54_06800 [Candidatus Eisenbacteria bacterium]
MNPELWQTRPLLALASLVPILLGALWMAAARDLPGLRGRPAVVGWLTWLLTRVGLSAVIWGLLGHQGVDQLTFFLPQARAALEGGVPYRDFHSAYAPLFAPLLGLTVRGLGMIGPLVLFLLADLGAWRALAAAEGEDSEAAWAWCALPMVWYFTVRYAQDESLAACCVCFAWWAMRRERAMLAGLALGIGLLITKPLFLLLALPFVLAAGARRGAVLLGTAIPTVVGYGALLMMHAPILQPLTLEGANFGVGPTLWRVPVVLLGIDLGPAGWSPFLLLVAWGAWRMRKGGVGAEAHGAWQFAAFAAFAPKFMPMYALMWAPLLALWAAPDADRRGWLLVYGVLLPLAWYLDSGPLQGVFGAGWQVTGVLGLVSIALLSLWPLRAMLRQKPIAP